MAALKQNKISKLRKSDLGIFYSSRIDSVKTNVYGNYITVEII